MKWFLRIFWQATHSPPQILSFVRLTNYTLTTSSSLFVLNTFTSLYLPYSSYPCSVPLFGYQQILSFLLIKSKPYPTLFVLCGPAHPPSWPSHACFVEPLYIEYFVLSCIWWMHNSFMSA